VARIAPGLRALVSNLIDYAGLYPPANLPLAIVTERYRAFRGSPDAWMLNRLVLPQSQLSNAPVTEDWRITLIVDREPGPLPPEVETLETKLPGRLSRPTYCEAPLAEISGAWAKVRTGGLTADAIPPAAGLAQYLEEAAGRRLAFKATAGLHHPIRSQHRLTYAADSPSAEMHGFLNVFLAACFAWHGMGIPDLIGLLEETDPKQFTFSEEASWAGRSLSVEQIESARREFAHSFGSCSFEEPVSELRDLGLIA
jgi:hypothetical protein